jgi:uncharacterized membrane protein YccC
LKVNVMEADERRAPYGPHGTAIEGDPLVLFAKFLSKITGTPWARRAARDVVRLALQAAVASSVTYWGASFIGMEDRSWAVISALLVVHTSIGSTMRAGIWRAFGTVTGCGLALVSIYILPDAGSATIRLVVVSSLAAPLVYWRPPLQYALVSGPVLAITPVTQSWESAAAITGAILLGSAVGVITAWIVWPQSSKAQALRCLRAALIACRCLWETLLRDLNKREMRPYGSYHRQITNELNTLREHARECLPRDARLLGHSADALERLWHSIVIIERVCGDERANLSDHDLGKQKLWRDQFEEAVSSALESIAARLRDPDHAIDRNRLDLDLQRAETAIQSDLQEEVLSQDPDRDRAVQALAFGIREFIRSVRGLAQCVEPIGQDSR